MIELSRTKKDKRVFGVLGDPKRNNSRAERMIVNSVGEGGVWGLVFFFFPEMTNFLANLAGIFANSIFCRNFR
jgi:hypothetical protein